MNTLQLNEKTKALIAIGASITANCQPCLDYHVAHARKTGAEDGEILAAIEVGKQVRRGASAKMDEKVGLLSSGPVGGRAEASCGCH